MNFPDFQQNSKFPWLILKFPDFYLTLNFPDFSLTSGNPEDSITYFKCVSLFLEVTFAEICVRASLTLFACCCFYITIQFISQIKDLFFTHP